LANLSSGTTVKKISIREFISEILRIPTVLVLLAVFFGANFVAMVFLTWMPSFLYEKFHMSLTVSGVTATVFIQTASMIGVLCGGWTADGLSKRRPAGRMITQSCGLFLGAPFIFLTGWTLSVPVLIVAMIGFGFFKGLYDANIFASVFDVVRPEMRATASGVMNTIGWLGRGIAPLAIGIVAPTIGMSAAIALTSIIYLLVGSLMVFGILVFVRKDIAKLSVAMRQKEAKHA
jgi:sugar phosphate permease